MKVWARAVSAHVKGTQRTVAPVRAGNDEPRMRHERRHAFESLANGLAVVSHSYI